MKAALLNLLCISILALVQQTGKWGDQGNGRFRNPIIAGDYSDPDSIRVAKHYYMVASTCDYSPGVTILYSRNLVNPGGISQVFSRTAMNNLIT